MNTSVDFYMGFEVSGRRVAPEAAIVATDEFFSVRVHHHHVRRRVHARAMADILKVFSLVYHHHFCEVFLSKVLFHSNSQEIFFLSLCFTF
jgi:hypothetical protein